MITQTINSTLIYLGCPYSDPDHNIMQLRHDMALRAVVHLLHQGLFVYSPIVHNHPVVLIKDLGRDWDYWSAFDLTVLDRCDELYVLTMPGWKNSKGLTEEIKFATSKSLPIIYMCPYTEELTRPPGGR